MQADMINELNFALLLWIRYLLFKVKTTMQSAMKPQI